MSNETKEVVSKMSKTVVAKHVALAVGMGVSVAAFTLATSLMGMTDALKGVQTSTS